MPQDGDIFFCFMCGHTSVFTSHGTELREPTVAESAILNQDVAYIKMMQENLPKIQDGK